MTIPDASKVKLVDGRKSSRGSKLSEIVTSNNAIAGINAGGFSDDGGVGAGNLLNTATIMNKTLNMVIKLLDIVLSDYLLIQN